MEEIIRIIEEKLSKLKEEEKGKKELERLKLKINGYLDNPDGISDDKDEFKFIFSDEDTSILDSIINLCGLYSYKESQILSALDNLKVIVDKRVGIIDEEISKIQKTINDNVNKYEELINLLKNYNEDTYVSLSDLSEIREIVGESEELLELYLLVAINNSKIELKQLEEQEVTEEEQVLPREVIEDLETARTFINTTVDVIVESVNKKTEYLKVINEFISKSEYKELDEELYSLALPIILSTKAALEDEKSKFDFDDVEEGLDLEDIVWVEDNDLKLLTTRALLAAYDLNDVEKVREVVNYYKSNKSIDIKEYLTLEGMKEYASMLYKLEDKYKVDENIESVEGIQYEDVIASDSAQTLQNDTYLLQIIYKDILELLSDRKIDDEIKTKLDLLIDRGKNILDKNDVSSDEDKLSEFYSNFENYLVFFDIDKFNESYDNLRNSHHEMSDSLSRSVDGKFVKLRDYSTLNLRNEEHSHNIHIRKGVPNSYEILDLKKGLARLSFKIIEGAKVTDENGKEHPVVLVIHTCYGAVDGNSKNVNLRKGVDIFRDDVTGRYEELQRIFSKEANENGLSQAAREELEKSLIEIEKIHDDVTHKQSADIEDEEEVTLSDMLDNGDDNEELGGKAYEKK